MTTNAPQISSPYADFKATSQPPSRTEVGLSRFETIMDLLEYGHSQVLTQKQLVMIKDTVIDNLVRIESESLPAKVGNSDQYDDFPF